MNPSAKEHPERLKLWIAYDGGPFRGWQSQTGGNTIQDHIEAAFEKLCGRRVILHGAGRTDAGVHALRQCAHAEIPRRDLTLAKWTAALNAHLPPQIRILRCSHAPPGFHARYSARRKVYTYRIRNERVLPPLEFKRAWHLPGPLDFDALELCAPLLAGTHDFAGFAVNRGKPDLNTIRTIYRVAVRRAGPLVTLTFEGNGFLYKMVRLMTGTMVRIAQGRQSPGFINELFDSGGKSRTSFAAPAEGLYLARVVY